MQNELNLKIEANAREVDSTLEKLISTLKKVDSTMNSVLKNIESKNPTKSMEDGIDRVTNKADKLKSAMNFAGVFAMAKTATKTFGDLLQQSIDYSENLNLYNVALDDLSEKGMKFQNTINEAFGTNQSETLRYQGIFQAISKSMGIANDSAYKLSEGLTKIGFDLASLYNISDTSAMKKLRAGLVGETEPLRAVGLDVTENSLKPIIQRLDMRDSEGELLTPRQLNYAEKMLLRYIAIVDQAKVAQGDFANTIEAPANQLKILGMQCKEAQRALGNLFVGAFAKLLPYAVAVVMVIKEVANAIAGVFGIEISDYNSGLGSLEDAFVGVEDSTSNIGDNLDKADKKAKKLQRTTMGFDEIHSISTPTSTSPSSSGIDGGIGSGINPKLLAALGDYENGMEKVRMKANAIRDAIMKWLGFTYDAEKGLWTFNKGLTPIKVILGTIGALLASKVIKGFRTLASVMGSSGLGRVVKALISPTTSLFSNMIKGIKGSHSSLKGSINSWREQQGIISSTTGKLNGFTGVVNGAKIALIGLATGVVGLTAVSMSMKSIAEDGFNLANSLGYVGGALTAIASGATIGSIFGPWGTIIGGATGALTTLIATMHGYKNAQSASQKELDRNVSSLKEYIKGIKEERQAIEDNMNAELAHITQAQTLANELNNIVDANGKIKDGYEDRAQFILGTLNKAYGIEYSIIDGVIQNYGKLKKSIQETIEAKKAEIILNANEKTYANALERQVELWKKKEDTQKSLNKVQKEYKKWMEETEILYNGLDESVKEHMSLLEFAKMDKHWESYTQSIQSAEETLKKADEAYKQNVEDIINYETLQTSVITGNEKKREEAIRNYTNTLNTEKGKQKLTLGEEIKHAQENAEKIIAIEKNKGNEINTEIKSQAYSQLMLVAQNLTDQTSKVTELSKPLKTAWKTLSEENYDVYAEQLSKLSPEMRQQIQNVTGVITEKTPELEKATNEMATKMVDKMKKDREYASVAKSSIANYLNGLSDSQQRKLLEDCGVKNVEKVMSGLKKGNISTSVGIQVVQGLNNGLKNNYWQGQVMSTALSFSNNVLKTMKAAFGIKSPSRKTAEFGKYLGLGLPKGLNQGKNTVLSQISDYSDDIVSAFESPFEYVNKELKFDNFKPVDINTNHKQEIMKTISNNSKIEFEIDVIGEISKAVCQAINNQQINVNVDVSARTEKGTIVETAINGINREYARTGRSPIKVA
ncbi:MAG: hypothetical protein HFH45_01370 [Bacilli bacterium]|nr:hypothetical protein [Bacilli bacterium]